MTKNEFDETLQQSPYKLLFYINKLETETTVYKVALEEAGIDCKEL